MYKFAVRLTKVGKMTKRTDKVYAVCDTWQEAFEITDVLNARGTKEVAWVDTIIQ